MPVKYKTAVATTVAMHFLFLQVYEQMNIYFFKSYYVFERIATNITAFFV